MEILQIEEYVKTKVINVLDLEFVKTKVWLLNCVKSSNDGKIIKTLCFIDTNISQKSADDTDNKDAKTPKEQKKYVTAQTPLTMPGHTGYLTFATLPPIFAR